MTKKKTRRTKKDDSPVKKYLRAIGKKGGEANLKKYGREYFSELARKGGRARAEKLKKDKEEETQHE